MTDAIGPSYNRLPPITPPATDIPTLAKQLQTHIAALAENLQKILEDPTLSEQSSFLQKMSADGLHLHQDVEQAIHWREPHA